MTWLVICAVAATASALTFLSGFGLGTLLLPAFALFYPIEQAVAYTAIVHFLNGLFKLGLVGRHANRRVVMRFGLPAIGGAWLGAWTLEQLAGTSPLARYSILGLEAEVTPAKLVVGLLLLLFTVIEFVPRLDAILVPARLRSLPVFADPLPIGGLLSGFFGGLAGLQGALRSAILIRVGLTKEAYVATGVVIACLIDVSRLAVYATSMSGPPLLGYGVLAAAVAAAFAGSWLGNRYLKKVTLQRVQRLVAAMLLIFAIGLLVGVL